ncbi:MAG: trigger factor [Bacilli bacterium]|nr:trigger factor [Bacilli bacterium]
MQKNVKEIEISIEGKEWEEALDKAYKAKKKDIKLDGFRKGTVPKDVYFKQVGAESLFMDAINLSIDSAYQKMMADNKIEPVCQPSVDVTHVCKNEATFKFRIIEKPEIKLGKYKKIGIKKEDVKVSKEEIETEINRLRNQYADVIEDNDGIVEKGLTAVINFKGIVDGKELEGGSGEAYPLEIGSNSFIPGFEEALIGMKIGEEKIINLKFPEDYVDKLKGKDVEFTVKIEGIKKRVLPELNKDFYEDLGYDDITTENELESKISKHLLERKEADAENSYIDQLLKKATENLEVEINPEIIAEEVKRILEQYTQQLQMQGITLDQYFELTKTNKESTEKMMEPEAINRIKSRYLLEKIAEKEKIVIEKTAVEEEITKLAEAYQTTEEEFLKMVDKNTVEYDLKMRQAIEILKS